MLALFGGRQDLRVRLSALSGITSLQQGLHGGLNDGRFRYSKRRLPCLMTLEIRRKPSCASPFASGLFVFIAVFGLYLYTMPKGIALEDDGLFVLAAYFNGTSHPPGYPVHSFITHLFSQIPYGSVAARVHAVSAFFGSLTCVVLFYLIRRIVSSDIASLAAVLAFACTTTFWSQSIVAEVYTLNTFLFFLVFLLVYIYTTYVREEGRGAWLIYLAAFVYGLALANHWPLVLLGSAGLLLLCFSRGKQMVFPIIKSVPFVLVGLLPYLVMFLRTREGLEIMAFGPIENTESLIDYILRRQYAGVDQSAVAGVSDKIQYSVEFAWQAAREFTLPVFAIITIGFIAQFRYGLDRWLIAALAAVFIGSSVVLIAMLGFDFDRFNRLVIRVYPLLAFGVMSVWLAMGLVALRDWLAVRKGASLAGCFLGIACVAVVSLNAVSHAGLNNRHAYDFGTEYGMTILESLPTDAVLFVRSDIDTGVLGYLHYVEGVRPDISLYHSMGAYFSNRLFEITKTAPDEQQAIISSFVSQSERPVVFMWSATGGMMDEEHNRWLVYYPDLTAGEYGFQFKDYLDSLLRQKPTDSWTDVYRETLLTRYIDYHYNYETRHAPEAAIEFLKSNIEDLTDNYSAQLNWLRYIINDPSVSDSTILQLFADIEMNIEQAHSKAGKADFYRIQAVYHMNRGKKDAARQSLEQSLAIWPDASNQANRLLKQLE
jgi:hypothetical protein